VNEVALRAAELNLAGEEIDAYSGLPARYAQKLLGPNPIRRLGAISLGSFLGALAVRGVLVEDKAAVERLRNQTTPRKAQFARPGMRAGSVQIFADAQVHAANSKERRAEQPQVFGQTIGQTARTESSERTLGEEIITLRGVWVTPVQPRSACFVVGEQLDWHRRIETKVCPKNAGFHRPDLIPVTAHAVPICC
jgi:hypothetical protein